MKLIIAWIIVTLTALGCLAIVVMDLIAHLDNWRDWVVDAIVFIAGILVFGGIIWAVSTMSL